MGRVIPFIACVLVHTIATATVLVPAEFREIVGGSEIIAHARIVDVRPQWADGRRWIDSIVTAEVLTSLKGGVSDTVTFKVPGGQLGRYRSVVVGAPVFNKGDEAVLFLKQGSEEWPSVFGLNQGVFRVRRDARTGQQIVVPPVMSATVATAASTAEGSRSGAAPSSASRCRSKPSAPGSARRWRRGRRPRHRRREAVDEPPRVAAAIALIAALAVPVGGVPEARHRRRRPDA